MNRESRKKNKVDWEGLKLAREGKVSLLDQLEVRQSFRSTDETVADDLIITNDKLLVAASNQYVHCSYLS